jgi:hypothetical protein
MKSNIELDRRKVLGTVGGLALAGSGLAAFTGSAAATVEADFTANNAGTVASADGSVRKVMVDTAGTFSWNGPDSAVVTLETKPESGIGLSSIRPTRTGEGSTPSVGPP